jgi:serine protease Do
VKLGELTDQQAKASGPEDSGDSWGMTVSEHHTLMCRRFQLERTQKGVIVTDLDPGSSAETAGLQVGDVIEEVNRQPVDSVEALIKQWLQQRQGDLLASQTWQRYVVLCPSQQG